MAVEAMRAKGPPRVVLTMGEQGVLYSDGASVKHVPAMKVDVVDTTVCAWCCVGVCGSVWCCVGVCGSVWECVVLCGSVWECVGVCGSVWCCVVLCGSVWECVGVC